MDEKQPDYGQWSADFTKNSRKAVEKLIADGRLVREPLAVAQLILRCRSLNDTAVGDYLGDGSVFASSLFRQRLRINARTAYQESCQFFFNGAKHRATRASGKGTDDDFFL